ncbi:MAG: tetratricopeptide repeat protein [Candidatus Nitrosoglobus sp.]|jgi:tetratricopeptide (TPR) repeat protein
MKQAPFQLAAGLISLLLLASCATSETRPAAVAKTREGTLMAQPKETAIAEIKYPPVKLTPKLLYQLLSAEIAGQRGQIGYAMRNYLLAAEETRDPRLAERAARIALFARDINYATQASRLWVETNPDNEDAQQVLVSMLLGQQRYDEAENHLEQLIAHSSGTSEQAFLKVAALLAGSSDPEAALMLMSNLTAFQTKDPDALYGYAYLALQLNQLNIALQTVNQVIAQRPDSDKPIIMRSRILQQQGKGEAALKSLESAINKGKATFFLRLAYGQMLIETDHMSKAQALFEQLEQEQPENPDVSMALGILATEQLEYKQAEDYFQRLLEVDRSAAQARFYLGRLAELQNHPEMAINWYSSITKGALVIDAQVRQAVLMAQQNHMQEARRHLQMLSKNFPDQMARFQLAEGEILVDAGRYKEAMAYYNKVLRGRSDDTNLLYARAMVAENLGQLDIFERDLRRVLEISPNNAEALNALGYTLAARTRRFDEALHYISRAMELKPNNAFILDSMGWVHYRLGNYNKAEEYLLKAMQIHKDPEIAAHLGEVLWLKGDKAGARKVWQRSLEKNQGNKALLKVMQRFQK